MGVAEYDEGDECHELDVSAVVFNRLLSEDVCLVGQLDDCACEDDDDQVSLAGTFVGDDETEDDLLSSRTLVEEEDSDDRPSLFAKHQRTDSMCSSFSMRETMTSMASSVPCACPCGRSSGDRKRSRVLSEEYLDATVRHGLTVKVAGIESFEMNSRFVLRVEDHETKKSWDVRKNTKEMAAFYDQIRHIGTKQAPMKKEMWGTFRGLRKLRLPTKFLHSRGKLCYQRSVVYDSLMRHTAALVSPAPMGPRRRQVVALLQDFLEVPSYCDVSERDTCNCFFFSNGGNATQLVNEIFSDVHHAVNRECAEFVAALVKSTFKKRRTKLYPHQAKAILRAVSRKMTEAKKNLLSDVTLLQQVGTLRHEMAETDFDDFVDDVRRAAAAFVQKAVLVELEDHVQEALHALYGEEEEKLLLPKMALLKGKCASYFGIPRHLQASVTWDDAREELRRMSEYSLPLDKLQCILRACSAIFRACSDSSKTQDAGDACPAPVISTDELLQILFYVLVTSDLAQPLRVMELLRHMCDQDDLTGEMGYYFTNFEAAMKLVEDHNE